MDHAVRNGRGFTLTEMLVATVTMGIIGTALTRILITDSRFVSRVDAMMNARQAGRAAMNTMAVELNMVSGGGLLAASPTDVRARVPYTFGVLCERRAGLRYAALVPTDSMMYSTAQPNGLAWLNDSADYTYMTAWDVQSLSLADPSACTDQRINILAGGQFVRMQMSNDTLNIGDVFYLYQTVRYRFYESAELPGRMGLWRRVGGGVWDELLAPFDASSGFQFYVGNGATPQPQVPADLSTVTGLDLILVGASEVTPQGSTGPLSFEVRTRVNFLNHQ